MNIPSVVTRSSLASSQAQAKNQMRFSGDWQITAPDLATAVQMAKGPDFILTTKLRASLSNLGSSLKGPSKAAIQELIGYLRQAVIKVSPNATEVEFTPDATLKSSPGYMITVHTQAD